MVANDAKMVTKVAKLAANLVTKMMPIWLYHQDFAKFSLDLHYNALIHLGQDKGLACCDVLPSVLSVVIFVSAPQRHSVFLGLCKDLPSSSAAPEKVLCNVSGLPLLESHVDSFPSQVMHFLHPCLEFFDILLRRQKCSWRPAEQKICRQTKITSKEHLGWGIAGGLMNCTPVGKQEKEQFLVPVLLITGYQEREAVQDVSIELIYHAVRLRRQSSCPGFVDGEYFSLLQTAESKYLP
ncbi:hypothetical protein TNCV_1594671 [Trichonephila clavipes]|nr:hypothetical protein TNCV_1594671 [Trichonephila clavipes]